MKKDNLIHQLEPHGNQLATFALDLRDLLALPCPFFFLFFQKILCNVYIHLLVMIRLYIGCSATAVKSLR